MTPNALPPDDNQSYLEPTSSGMGYTPKVPRDVPTLRWYKAARFLVVDGLEESEVALKIKCSTATLHNWKRKPAFQKILSAYREQLSTVIFSEGVAHKVFRVRKLDQHVRRLEKIMVERSKEFEEAHLLAVATYDIAMAEAVAKGDDAAIQKLGNPPARPAGVSTGMVTVERKGAGAGGVAEVNDVFSVDAVLHKAYLDTLEQAAKEMGDQFEGPKEAMGPNGSGVRVSISFPVMNSEDLAKVESAQVIDLPPTMQRLLNRPSDGMPR